MIKPVVVAVLGLALAGCSDQKPATEAPIDVSLAPLVLDEVPSDVPNRTFIDFEGKVHLVGWSVEPADKVAPGQTFKLTLYWKSATKLAPGWKLFTHLVAPGNQRVDKGIDNIGQLRGSLQPSSWKPGKVYVDVQDIQMPADVYPPSVAVAVGIWRENSRPEVHDNARLDVISGPADAERRAIVTHIKIAESATPQQPAARPMRPDLEQPRRPQLVQPQPGQPQPMQPAGQPAQPAPGGQRPAAPGHEGHDHP